MLLQTHTEMTKKKDEKIHDEKKDPRKKWINFMSKLLESYCLVLSSQNHHKIILDSNAMHLFSAADNRIAEDTGTEKIKSPGLMEDAA
jgi:hypothetical protein